MGTKLKREVRCRMCGTIQDADNEHCGKCGVNLFSQLTCDDCTHKEEKHLKNVKGRCWNFDQVDFSSKDK